MSNSRKSLKKLRAIAYKKQGGLCYYCKLPMWIENPSEFTEKHNLSISQARLFQCTGEHLKAHCSGGAASIKNIVAACFYCNQHRHRRNSDLSPQEYKRLVHSRLVNGRWNSQLFPQNRLY